MNSQNLSWRAGNSYEPRIAQRRAAATELLTADDADAADGKEDYRE
jgi:hypothetical protein